MGWTHDYRDVAGTRRADRAQGPNQGGESPSPEPNALPDADVLPDRDLGIPIIIRRRARWVSARLRHPAPRSAPRA
ncbi:hypothetical protein [Streptomyces sp. NPDC060194]|uniref:hypothetical protein n=1 Tax=Streptomyces sp. NPDC060194 TaxID=3347069 RepID=UPI0036501B94